MKVTTLSILIALSEALKISEKPYTNQFQDGYWSEIAPHEHSYEKMKAKLIDQINKNGVPPP